MIQEEQQDERPSLLLQCDMERSGGLEEVVVYRAAFSPPARVLQIRIVRGGTIAHASMRDSITQKGEEIEKLEIFARTTESERGFVLVCSAEKISEKGNHDTIMPIDSNHAVFFVVTSDAHRFACHQREV